MELREKEEVVDPVHTYRLPAVKHLQRLLKGPELGASTKRHNDHIADHSKVSKAASSYALTRNVIIASEHPRLGLTMLAAKLR